MRVPRNESHTKSRATYVQCKSGMCAHLQSMRTSRQAYMFAMRVRRERETQSRGIFEAEADDDVYNTMILGGFSFGFACAQ